MTVDRAVSVEGLRNMRDVGGLPASEGRVTRRGVLYRSEAPIGLSAQGIRELATLRLATVVDMRHERESGFVATTLPDGIQRVLAGVEPPADSGGKGLVEQVVDGDRLDYTAVELTSLYFDMLQTQSAVFGRVVGFMADPEHLPILVHCQAGKDRTGLAVALALEAIGVERQAVVDDYELSTHYRAYRREEVAPALAASGSEWSRVKALFGAPAEVLEASFAEIERRNGSVRAYLIESCGVTEETLDLLAELLLETRDSERGI